MQRPSFNGRGALVIGYGSDLRGDDGAGAQVAARLAEHDPEARVIVAHQLMPELADEIATAERVVFVDAYPATAPDEPLRVERLALDGCVDGVAKRAPTLGHRNDPADLLRLAGRLFGRIPEAWVVGIPAYSFALEAGISAATSRRIDEAVALIGGQASSGTTKGE